MTHLFFKKTTVLALLVLLLQAPINAADTDKDPNLNPQQVEENIEKTEKTNSEKVKDLKDESVAQGENLFTTVKQGGPLMVFILILGILGLTIIVERIIFYVKSGIWKKSELEEYLTRFAGESKSRFREQLDDELREAFQIYINSAEKGLALLNGLGNIAPIFGFLGTVIGMISAFAAIAAATTVNAKVVAVGIQIALVTTAGGLIIAAPILACFHIFNHIIQNIYKHADELIYEKTSRLPSMLVKQSSSEEDELW
jgi:biopolymer transport protein ExbB